MHIKIQQVHVRLQKSSQILGLICFDEQETCSSTCQVVPTLDVFWMICTYIMHFDNTHGDLFAGCVCMPLEFAIPQHCSSSLVFLHEHIQFTAFNRYTRFTSDGSLPKLVRVSLAGLCKGNSHDL